MKKELLVLLNLRVEILHPARCTYVDIEHMYLCVGIPLTDVCGLLHRCEAADRRAVREVVLITGPGALHKSDLGNVLAVGGAHNLALGRPILRRVPLHHDIGDNVRILAEAQVIQSSRIVGLPAGRPHDGADLGGEGPRLHVELDGVVVASLIPRRLHSRHPHTGQV